MKKEMLEILCCPFTKEKLFICDAVYDNKLIKSGTLINKNKDKKFEIVNFIPRFVKGENYSENFGIQWNAFRKTQLDSFSGHPISENRFWNATNWSKEEIKDQWVLDVGCGAGRFTEIALKAGAKVIALDYSNAVEACYENLKHFNNFHIIQADIYNLPFYEGQFNYVYCLGVLQHTPDVKASFDSISKLVSRNGKICVDYYWKRIVTMMNPKYILRPVTKKLSNERLFKFLILVVPQLLKLSIALSRVYFVGKLLKRLIPVANYKDIFPLSDDQLKDWALLDTFDMLAPTYDNPQTVKTVRSWLIENKYEKIEVLHASHLVARGQKI